MLSLASVDDERHCSGSCSSFFKTKETNACGPLWAARSVRRPRSCGAVVRIPWDRRATRWHRRGWLSVIENAAALSAAADAARMMLESERAA